MSVTYPPASSTSTSPLLLHSKSMPYQSIWHFSAHLVLFIILHFCNVLFLDGEIPLKSSEVRQKSLLPWAPQTSSVRSSKVILQDIWNLVEHKALMSILLIIIILLFTRQNSDPHRVAYYPQLIFENST